MTEKEKLTIVVFSGDLDRALSAFILATTSASMGMEVDMFFTFWGLNIIKRLDQLLFMVMKRLPGNLFTQEFVS